MHTNLALLTDSYKVSHWRQYPPGTKYVYSYFESRGGDYPEVVFFGLQYLLKRYLAQRITIDQVQFAADFWKRHFNDPTLFNYEGWMHIVSAHGGKLPLHITAVPEGTPVPPSNVLMTVENTDPKVPWLTNWVETILSQVWYPSTVATYSRECKRVISDSRRRTGTLGGAENFSMHDFGYRGVSSVESAGIGGAAHLVNFMGTDTAAALEVLAEYYGEPMAGFSIPAAEHSTITSWGGPEFEVEAFRNMIHQFGQGGSGLYAVVSDSYDVFNACSKLWGGVLKDAVLAAPNTLVVRPDSGIPHHIVPDVIEELGKSFGFTINEKGYRVLNKVRVIQGDGIDLPEIRKILDALEIVHLSADNVAFGCGGGLLQKHNRDTCKFAFKCSHIAGGDSLINSLTTWERDVYKSPITDLSKQSKRGRQMLVKDTEGFHTYNMAKLPKSVKGSDMLLYTEFLNGTVIGNQTLANIRARAQL